MKQGAVWVPDWPASAAILAGLGDGARPLAVVNHREVISSNEWARRAGISVGMKKKEAATVVEDLQMIDRDEEREIVLFEPVVRALDSLISHLILIEPGSIVFPARGPLRTYGSPDHLAESIIGEIADISSCEAQVGIGEGTLAALAAARHGLFLEGEESRSFLSQRPIFTILDAVVPQGREELFECLRLLHGLGIRTIGDVAELGSGPLVSRFGSSGLLVWDLANGSDSNIAAVTREAPILVHRAFEPPLAGAQEALFFARELVNEILEAMANHSLSGGRLSIVAHLHTGQEVERSWAIDGASSKDIMDRVRWQLGAWSGNPEGGNLSRLDLRLEEGVRAGRRADVLWGGRTSNEYEAMAASERLRTLVGEEGVRRPIRVGGRSPRDSYVESSGEYERREELPWPGQIPEPGPVIVSSKAVQVTLLDRDGHPLGVDGEGTLGCPFSCERPVPSFLDREGISEAVIDHAGPWILQQRWWNAKRASRRAYLQIVVPGGAFLIYCEAGTWHEEGRYE